STALGTREKGEADDGPVGQDRQAGRTRPCHVAAKRDLARSVDSIARNPGSARTAAIKNDTGGDGDSFEEPSARDSSEIRATPRSYRRLLSKRAPPCAGTPGRSA